MIKSDSKLINSELTIDSGKEIKINSSNKQEGIYYTKVKKINFPVIGLKFFNIPVLKSVQLSFYEKYSILLLKKGVIANDKVELAKKISLLLNINENCINEFIDYLLQNDFINYNNERNIFMLDKSINYVLDKNYDNAMFAEFDVKNADCNKIIYVEDIDSFYLADDFNSDVFIKNISTNKNKTNMTYSKIDDVVVENKKFVDQLLIRNFNNTNMHLQKNLNYDLKKEFIDYQYEFDAIIEYKYFKNLKKAIRQKVIVSKENFLQDDFINKLTEQFDIDERLPKFIDCDENFYQKIDPNFNSMEKVEDNIENHKNVISHIKEQIKSDKNELTNLKKKYRKEKDEKTNLIDKAKKEIVTNSEKIKINEELVSHNESDNQDLINKLTEKIHELKESKVDLETKLDNNQKIIEDLEAMYKKKEDDLNNKILENEEKIENINNSIIKYENEKKELLNDYKALLSKNEKKLHPIISKVLNIYNASKNIFCIYVSDICIELDKAISASEYNSFDEVGRACDMIREMYRKVLQVTFDVLLKKNEKNLGAYFSDPYNLIALNNLFKKRNVDLDIKNKLIIFHKLSGAIGHSQENGVLKQQNKQQIEDFKKLDLIDREKILLAIPTLFSSIMFTKTELKEINNKLKM